MSGMKRNLQEMYNNSNGTNNSHQNVNGNHTNGNQQMSNNNNQNQNMNNNNNVNLKQEDISDGNDQQTMLGNTANEAKKTRLDNIRSESNNFGGQNGPSRVVHLRNIPQQLTDNDICFLGLHFGHLNNVLFLRGKNQAFLEFGQLSEAQQMCQYFANATTTFSGKKIFVQYSNHQTLNTDPNNSNNLVAQAALQDSIQLNQVSKDGGKNTVLRASVLNMVYPVTVDVFHQIFSKFGTVLKIITFTKNDMFQVLIQMKDSQSAQSAKMSLHGQNIYNGCCTLQIDFSKLTTLEVNRKNTLFFCFFFC
jgi:polypyrimidine tract-binding protein 1